MSQEGAVQATNQPHPTMVQGIWKFKDSVRIGDLISAARDLLGLYPTHYISMTVRRCSKDQLGICFQFDLEVFKSRHGNRAFEEFDDECKDRLYRKFGTRFCGWDVTDDIYIVK